MNGIASILPYSYSNSEIVYPATPEPEGYVSIKVVAQRCNKSTRTIQSWMRLRKIPYIQIGRSVLFDWPMVKAHIDKNYQIR